VSRVLRASLFTVAIAATLALPLRAAGKQAIEGLWQLVAASPVAPAEIEPHGMLNQKLYFSPGGRIYLMRPEERFSAEMASARYEYDGTTRKVTLPDGAVRRDPVQIAGDTMKVTLPDGQVLTYRRVTGEHPLERSLAPITVESVAAANRPQPAEPAYDETDHSKQPFAERIRGVWEVVRYAKLKGDVPANGFPNEKYVIDGKQIAIVEPDATTVGDAKLPYTVSKDSLVVGGEAPALWTVTFNAWQQLVLTRDDAEVSLRLVQKSTATIPALPAKIAVVD